MSRKMGLAGKAAKAMAAWSLRHKIPMVRPWWWEPCVCTGPPELEPIDEPDKYDLLDVWDLAGIR